MSIFGTRGLRRLAILSGAALLIGPALPAQARPVTPAAISAPDPTVAAPPDSGADHDSAAALAYRWQQPMEVASARSSRTREWAMPDGSFTAEVYLGDEWTPGPIPGKPWNRIDLTLSRRGDGSIRPAVDSRGLSLSGVQAGQGEHLVATLGEGAQQVGIGWPGPLPEPVLRENVATYAEVRPGVDLRVEALASGFEFSLVVGTREAAQALGTVRLPWRTGEYTPRKLETGAVELVAADGQVQGELPTADMFDASTSPETGEARQIGSMEMTPVGTQYLELTPDAAALADPATVYPVTLDPPVTLFPAFDAFVATNYRSDQSGSKDLKLGHVVDRGQSITARSYLRFDGLKKYAGADVVSAELFLWNYHSWSYSCDSAGWDAYLSPYVDNRLRWTNQPARGAQIGHSTLTKGDEPRCRGGWISIPAKNGFQSGFDNGWSSLSIMLRASSESSQLGWKRMYSSQAPKNRPYVSLRYNRKPGTPSALKISDCYRACTSPAMVRDHTPTLSAKVSDPDGGTVKAVYEVWTTAGTRKATSGNTLTGVRSGTARSWSVTPGLPDGSYRWRAQACDGYGCGGWSGWFSFTIDTTDPGLPLVFSTPYADRSTGTWNGGPGIDGQFSFGPNGTKDIAEYKYSLNNGAVVSAPTGPQPERLTADQQQVNANLDGFAEPVGATLARDTTLDHGGSVKASLKITPAAASTGVPGDSYAGLTRAIGCMCQNMTTGHRYMASGWIHVPAATGLSPAFATRGLRIVGFYKGADGAYHEVASKAPTAVGEWQQLHVVLTVPAGATEAFFRLYNGMDYGSGKAVYWDHLSVVEAKVVPIEPAKDGMNVLRVQALDKAGNLSDPRTYMFLVRTSGKAWLWGLDEGTGTTTASAPQNDRPAAFTGTGLSWTEPRTGEAAIASTGQGYLTTGSPVLNTQHPSGFSVNAWARLTDTGVPRRTIVAQEGTGGSMFRLEYRRDLDFDADGALDPAWCFTVTAADAPGAAESRACSREYVVPGAWIPLVGIYKADKTLELYVKGTPDLGGARATGPTIASWSATGPLSMGKARSGGAAVDLWQGDLDEVGAYQRELVATEILTFACGPDLSWCLEPSS